MDKSEGSRPLTKTELKAKELYEASRDPFVERLLPKSSPERSILSDLTPGLKIQGRIISIKDFGMFVDVGSEKDGLVHVKDISKDYFIQQSQLPSRFTPGQDVDVWVKFVDADQAKLGLQMFPLTHPHTHPHTRTRTRTHTHPHTHTHTQAHTYTSTHTHE